MVDAALDNAEKLRDRLATEINTLQQNLELKRKELERVRKFISDYNAFAQGVLSFGPDETLLPLPPVPVPAPPTEKYVNPDKSIVGDVAERILHRNGSPMGRVELFEAVKREGIDIRGKDPQMVFSTMLWRMSGRFIRMQGKGYWLRNEPCPAVNYWPVPPPPRFPGPSGHDT